VIFQERPVKQIVPRDAPTYGDLTTTCAADSCTSADLPPDADVVLEDADGIRYELGRVIVSQDNIAKAEPRRDETSASWTVDISLDGDGTNGFASATETAVSATPPMNQIAIVVDGGVVSAPTVQAPITSGHLQVTGLQESQAQALGALGGASPTA
jgi:preprotein translocase subunit SecD